MRIWGQRVVLVLPSSVDMLIQFMKVFLFTLQIAQSQNRIYLNAASLMMNISEEGFDTAADTLASKKKK